MSVNCEVIFDNSTNVFYTGQTVTGRVILTISVEPISFRAFYIQILGKAQCRWQSDASADSLHGQNETYLDSKIYFKENDDLILDIGTHSFNFECKLPTSIPSSFEAEFGSIRYEAIVKMNFAYQYDRTHSTRFTVIKESNLNEDQSVMDPVTMEDRERFACCCCFCCCGCESEPLDVVVRIPVSGYVPGQTINVELKVMNKSKENIVEFSAGLVKHIHYEIGTDDKKTYDEESVITTETTENCPSQTTKDLRINLVVPPTPPTDTKTSDMCKIQYYIKVFGLTDGCHMDIMIKVPVTIGTYPISDPLASHLRTLNRNEARVYTPSVVSHQPQSSGGRKPSAPYPEGEPPTYEEAAASITNTKDGFTSKYPVFRRTTSYSSSS